MVDPPAVVFDSKLTGLAVSFVTPAVHGHLQGLTSIQTTLRTAADAALTPRYVPTTT